jgi:hypothetical protein
VRFGLPEITLVIFDTALLEENHLVFLKGLLAVMRCLPLSSDSPRPLPGRDELYLDSGGCGPQKRRASTPG